MATPQLEISCTSIQTTLRRGDKGINVEALCRLLAISKRGFSSLGLQGDTFTPAIEKVVKNFQRQTFLEPDGVVGPSNWAALCANVPVHMPVLRLGNHGMTVGVAQKYLKKLGFYGGSIDAYFGPEMHFSLIDFQSTFGLVGDGILDTITWDKLGRASALAR
ncbi:MAG: peptidoglycan-binding domain-containing protein [Cyanobacteria bacterium P01_A01_bin.116]